MRKKLECARKNMWMWEEKFVYENVSVWEEKCINVCVKICECERKKYIYYILINNFLDLVILTSLSIHNTG